MSATEQRIPDKAPMSKQEIREALLEAANRCLEAYEQLSPLRGKQTRDVVGTIERAASAVDKALCGADAHSKAPKR